MAAKKKVKKKRPEKYAEKLKIHGTFDEAMKTLVSEPKPKFHTKKK